MKLCVLLCVVLVSEVFSLSKTPMAFKGIPGMGGKSSSPSKVNAPTVKSATTVKNNPVKVTMPAKVSSAAKGTTSSKAISSARGSASPFENEIGVLPPVGYWDPLGLVADGDADKFRFYREVEIKHGRVAMLAVTGYIIQEMTRFPGAIDLSGTTFASIPNGVGAIGAIPSLGWLQIVASIGYWELIGWEDRKGSDEPGDFGTGYFGRKLQGAEKVEKLTKELQNGRLAMLGIMALITHDIARPAGEGLFVLHHF